MNHESLLIGTPWRNKADHEDVGVLVGRTNGGQLILQMGWRPLKKGTKTVDQDAWEPVPSGERCPWCGELLSEDDRSGDGWCCPACGYSWSDVEQKTP